MGDPTLATAAISVLAKVAASLPDDNEQHLFHAISQVYRPDVRYVETDHIDTVRRASWKEEVLEIRYQDKDHIVSEREILPLAIMYAGRTLTVLSWCCLRENFRMFRTDRIIDVKTTGKSFRPRRASLLRDYLAKLHEDDAFSSDSESS